MFWFKLAIGLVVLATVDLAVVLYITRRWGDGR